jgi:hypothetical protein
LRAKHPARNRAGRNPVRRRLAIDFLIITLPSESDVIGPLFDIIAANVKKQHFLKENPFESLSELWQWQKCMPEAGSGGPAGGVAGAWSQKKPPPQRG